MADTKTIALSNLIGGLVQSLAKAKYLGDLQSSQYKAEYKGNSSISDFTVPAFSIGEVELNLRFSIDSLVEDPIEKIDVKININPEQLTLLQAHQISDIKIKLRPLEQRIYE
jgi:hypothetical protein